MMNEKCSCGHYFDRHDDTGVCAVCKCGRGDRLPPPGERITFGVHRIADVDARTAPAWEPREPTIAQRRAAIDRVLRRE